MSRLEERGREDDSRACGPGEGEPTDDGDDDRGGNQVNEKGVDPWSWSWPIPITAPQAIQIANAPTNSERLKRYMFLLEG
jgi:hypothetical protein